MESVYDVQQLLKRFGIIIYTRNRLGTLVLMEDEIKDLYQAKLISSNDFQKALLILRQEKSKLKEV